MRYLGRPMERLSASHPREAKAVALVDTQPGAGSNGLPAGTWPLASRAER
jgi:hypothetical protein